MLLKYQLTKLQFSNINFFPGAGQAEKLKNFFEN